MHSTYAQKIMESPDAPKQIEALVEAMNAEKLRRAQFREWATPPIKAEFINGEIIVHAPSAYQHWSVLSSIASIISIYVHARNLGSVGIAKVMIGLERNDYEPDLVFFPEEKAEQFDEEQEIFPAPDLVVEILSKETEAIDRGIKKMDYAANGIPEYWIVNPERQTIEQYLLFLPKDGVYSPAKIYRIYDEIESRAIQGFKIPIAAVFDDAINVQTIEAILKS